MDQQPANYHHEFLKSPYHAALGLVTLGAGFLSATLLGLVAGATCYALGWIYLPDLRFFRRWVDRRQENARRSEEAQTISDFMQRRETLLRSLSAERRQRYQRLTQVCRDIENASVSRMLTSSDTEADPRLRKLDELMWTFLRLLGIEEAQEQFLETEQRENVPALLKDAESEAAKLNSEVEGLKAQGNAAALDTKQRFLGSRLERLEVLRKRQQRIQQAQENLALVVSEQDRLEQQIKLIRADAVATRNADTLTARIDATVQHLDQTNKWLSELDEFKDLVGDMPPTDQRVGYETTPPAPATVAVPPVIEPPQPRKQMRQRQSQ
jgi:hypothetical protein